MSASSSCPKCGGKLRRMLFANSKGLGLFITADLLITVGITLFVVAPVTGWVGGSIVILIGVWLLMKIQRGWKCVACKNQITELKYS